jgi:hypothetical protein
MRTSREEANVSDGPPVEHSIMKRAWPYAVALAVVVTGCYLALAPLLRSLNPGPTGTSASQPLLGANTTTVQQVKKQPSVKYTSDNPGFTSRVTVKAKKSKKAKTPHKAAKVNQTPVFIQSQTTANSSSSSSSTTTSPSSTTTTTHTPTKPKTTKAASNAGARPPAVVGGTINQQDNGGFAGQGNGDSTLPPAGKTSTVVDG